MKKDYSEKIVYHTNKLHKALNAAPADYSRYRVEVMSREFLESIEFVLIVYIAIFVTVKLIIELSE